MMDQLSFLVTESVDPYQNIAQEEALLSAVQPGECILYLWQNRQTVVVGRNQNCRRECRVEKLEADGGNLARRLSGGGAVYHDMGNLNFTFVARRSGYDLTRQMQVILEAVSGLGIAAELTGRNDITAQGRKFSGNAFYDSGDSRYHHGTLLVDADFGKLADYLTVQQDKLQSHGVRSVQSRVCNLRELCPGLDIEQLRQALVAAFGRVYGLQPQAFATDRLDADRLAVRRAQLASWEWRIGAEPRSTVTATRRFGWGGVELGLRVQQGAIAQVNLYTDALEQQLAPELQAALTGVRFAPETVAQALQQAAATSELPADRFGDVAELADELF